MAITRRGLTAGTVGLTAARLSGVGLTGAGLAGVGLARPAIADSSNILIGWMGALTGPLAAPSIGFDRGMKWAVEQVNKAGGVKGRQIEVVVRDTQGDPTKAVNATQELISRIKVNACWGPPNSGESLATTPIMARATMPNLHPCVVNALIDPEKYPNAFRLAPSNMQWDDAARNYCLKILKINEVAVFGDSTGYGTSAVEDSVAGFIKENAKIVYSGVIDPNQSDLTPDLLRMRNAGAKALVCWSVTTGLNSRVMNTRAAIGWDVPIVGHPALGTGEVGKLVDKPANWENVYMVGYKSCSFGSDGKLPPRSQAFVDRVKGKIELADSVLWWVTCAVDAVDLVAKAVAQTGSTKAEAFIEYFNTVKKYPGIFGDYSFSPQQHNGYPTEEVIMSAANSQRDGAYALAPGYV
jgi:branched-chain amino acid transport system substrate-binding protein